MPVKRRTCSILLTFLALFLLGTVIVLSTISFYLHIDAAAYITPEEVETLTSNTTGPQAERIPRIIHQTWKTEILPDRWVAVSQTCKDIMPDYEYKLWTDATSREFIATRYSWFLPTFDAYTYPIQRADAIRYFVLYHFGGVYLDLDVGCLRSLDPLLVYPVILPKTIPVGVSNDLMFAERGHPFMEQTIHSLATFDHSYILNYPTVMFSTGPMFLSAQFGIYTASHPPSPEYPGGDVRILPKSLYGKNAKPGEAPGSFFSHHYGSSWHADDAAFITFLGTWGKALMWIGLVILIMGIARLVWQKKSKGQHGERDRRRFAFGRYDVMLPRAYHQDGSFHLDLGFVTMSEPSGITTEPPTPTSSFSSEPPSPSGEHALLPVSFGVRSSSPGMPSDTSREPLSIATIATRAFHRARTWVRASVTGYSDSRPQRRSSQRRGVMFFLPAIFAPSSSLPFAEHSIPLLTSQTSVAPQGLSRSRSPLHYKKDSEDLVLSDAASHATQNFQLGSSAVRIPPPPYEQGRGGPSHMTAEWIAGEAGWDEWTGNEDIS